MIRLALYQPDIAANAGAILRLGACFGVPVHIIHPAGFALSDRTLRRAGMDYLERAERIEHTDWAAFEIWAQRDGSRLVALTTRGETPLPDFAFSPDDILLLGRESAGLPDPVLAAADARLRIPLKVGARSLNVAVAAGIATAEALRQTGQFPA
ncbi:MAG: tRNA (cytidine(34)-2'-O)-methyltransferase [Hyphomicrobiales bacterium]|nr:tRNA (cytidine(34)-2'-O)-methyltransferase [Hyphomicrobiales bacterium]